MITSSISKYMSVSAKSSCKSACACIYIYKYHIHVYNVFWKKMSNVLEIKER